MTIPFAKTITGSFEIGYRTGDSSWQKNSNEALVWTAENSFGAIDLPSRRIAEIPKWKDLGGRVGSIDLTDWQGFQTLLSPDKARRAAAVESARRNIEQGADLGAVTFFTLMVPEDPKLTRAENFRYLVESYADLATTLESCGAKLVVEGWPGPGALCCTPETYRALFKEIPSDVMGVNYDPSHLLRMSIDHIRFLNEFIDRVFHVHAKDTEIISDNVYEFGTEQPATFAPSISFGEWAWRYTIPGHGVARWTTIFEMLKQVGYKGLVSIELEDARFNGSEVGEKLGLVKAREFLEGC